MRSEDFLEKLEDIRNDYGSALRKILKFNEKTTGYIEKKEKRDEFAGRLHSGTYKAGR